MSSPDPCYAGSAQVPRFFTRTPTVKAFDSRQNKFITRPVCECYIVHSISIGVPIRGIKINALIIYAHPEPTSFCSALKDAAVAELERRGVTVDISDLYAAEFNPVAGRHDFLAEENSERFHYQTEQLAASRNQGFSPEITREQGRVARADLFVFIFPLWWGGMPAILKGWFDRVLAYGFAYADGQRYDTGYFKGKRGVLAISTGGTKSRFSAEGSYGSMDSVLHGVRHCMLDYLGLETGNPFVAYAAPRVTQADREHDLREWSAQIGALVSDPLWIEQLGKTEATGSVAKIVGNGGEWAAMG